MCLCVSVYVRLRAVWVVSKSYKSKKKKKCRRREKRETDPTQKKTLL